MAKKSSLPAQGSHTKLKVASALPKQYDVLVIPIFSHDGDIELVASGYLSEKSDNDILRALESVGATGKLEELNKIPAVSDVDAEFILAVGLGDSDSFDDDALRTASATAARSLAGIDTAVTTMSVVGLAAATEGFGLGSYSYTGQRSQKLGAAPLKKAVLLLPQHSTETKTALKATFKEAKTVVDAVNLTRDLVNTPSSDLYPESYARIIEKLATKNDVEVSVLDEKQLKKEGFGGILAVGQGSARAPRLVRLEWNPEGARTHVALVGKGITFDTGGISLKPGASMADMISDMGGSAAIVATVMAAAELNLDIHITATIPLAENMPGGNAYRPGDVITHFGGITSEILNTDAEGRLVLADAMARASEDKPDYLIDVATLTGAQIVALGDRTAGVMGTDDFRDRVADTGNSVGENAWPMPMPKELIAAIKSPVADLRNISTSRAGGMLVAASYLKNFVGDNIEWAHIDVAGPAFNTGASYGYTPSRATGVPVRTLIQVLEDLAKEPQNNG